MQLYAILRRHGWASIDELGLAGQRSAKVGNEDMPEDIPLDPQLRPRRGRGRRRHRLHLRGLRPRRHPPSTPRWPTSRSNAIIPIADTVYVRPDPVPAAF